MEGRHLRVGFVRASLPKRDPGGPGPAPAQRVGLVEKNGVRLFARGVSMNMSRRVGFMGDQNDFDNSSLSLELGCELESGAGEAIASVRSACPGAIESPPQVAALEAWSADPPWLA